MTLNLCEWLQDLFGSFDMRSNNPRISPEWLPVKFSRIDIGNDPEAFEGGHLSKFDITALSASEYGDGFCKVLVFGREEWVLLKEDLQDMQQRLKIRG